MRTRPIVILLALLAALSPLASAHGGAEASELEVEVLADEGNDLNDARGGWDVTQAFLGEAHEHDLHEGPGGDGVYWRVELYGVPGGGSPLAMGEWRADLTFESPAGPITRSIRSSDGETFDSDFDLLRVNVSDGIVHVERALVLLDTAGLAVGEQLTAFRIETFVGDEPRDRAPGGIPIAGPIEAPTESAVSAEEYVLAGPSRFASASVTMVDGAPALRVQSLLKMGEQHVHAHLPPGVTSPDPLQVSVKPGEAVTFRLDLSAAPASTTSFDVTTDIGGRVSVVLAGASGARTLDVEGDDAPAVPVDAAGAKDVPGPAVALVMLAVALLAFVRRS